MNQIELECLNRLRGKPLADVEYNIYRVYIKDITPTGQICVGTGRPKFSKMVMKGIYYNNLVRQLSLNNSESIMSQLELVTYQRAEKEVLKPKRWVKIECSPGVLTSTSSYEKSQTVSQFESVFNNLIENSELVTQGLNLYQDVIDLVAKQKERDLMVDGKWIKTGQLGGVFSSFDLQEHCRAKRFKTVTKYVVLSCDGEFVYLSSNKPEVTAGVQIVPIEVKVPCE